MCTYTTGTHLIAYIYLLTPTYTHSLLKPTPHLPPKAKRLNSLQKALKTQAFVAELKTLPIAVQQQKANDQHYEVGFIDFSVLFMWVLI
jgi:hypothetical protein